MKRIARWGLKFLLNNPELLAEWIEPLLEKDKVRKRLQEHGPTVRRIIRALERAAKLG